jgi:hypothetical protein
VSDAVTVVISEETGNISVVVGGRFIQRIDVERLRMILGEYIREPSRSRMTLIFKQLRRVTGQDRRAA